MSIILAKEVIGKLENAKDIAYENKIIVGNLNIDNCKNLPKVFSGNDTTEKDCLLLGEEKNLVISKIRIKNCIINGNIDFHDTVFEKSFSLKDCTLHGYANFEDSKFCSDALFCKVQFLKNAKFSHTVFLKDTAFWLAEFHSLAQFREAISFQNPAHIF